MTPEQITAARARCEAATKGPWRKLSGGVFSIMPGDYICDKPRQPYYGSKFWRVNAEFIAHARTDLPAALDALEAERRRVAELEAELKAIHDGADELLGLIQPDYGVDGIGTFMRCLLAGFLKAWKNAPPPNGYTAGVTFPEIGRMTISITREGGKSIAESLIEAHADNARLRAALEAADPFVRVTRILEALPTRLADDRPIQGVLPHGWPTMRDLRALASAAKAALEGK